MPLKTILKNIGGTIKTVTEFVEDEVIDPISNEFEYRAKELEQFRANTFGTAEPDSWEMQTSNLVQKAVDASPVGVAEQGAIILGGNTAETVGLPRGVGEFVGGALAPGIAAPAPSAITRATRAATKNSVKTAVKETAEGLKTIGDDLMPPPPAALATAGAAPRLQLNVEKGGAVMKLTVEDPAILSQIPHVKKGIASTTEYAAGVQKLKKTKIYYELKRRIDQAKFEEGRITKDALKRANAKTQKMENAKLSTLATKMDPDIFEKVNYKNLDVTSDFKFLDQHHGGGTKAMTAPWVQTALKIGNDDDVVALFELHKALMGSGMGNVKSAIIDAPTVVHNVASASKAGRNVDEAIHSFMKKNKAGIEISSEKVYDIIGQPKNMDELLQKYITFVDEYLLPQKNLSLKAVRKEFARYRSTLPVSKHAQFDEYLSKLNMANTDIFADMP